MGRDSISICRNCKVFQANGYGPYSTWLDWCETVERYDAEVAKSPGLGERDRNKNARAFLVKHAGHDIHFTSGDTWYSDTDESYEDQFEGLTEEAAPFGDAAPDAKDDASG